MGDRTRIIVNGLPGKMATIIAEGIDRDYERDYSLVARSLTGPGMPDQMHFPTGTERGLIRLVPPERHLDILREVAQELGPVIAIDFTKGKGVGNRNAELYFKAGIPFVMGTTGVDYNEVERLSNEYEIPCIAHPNMDKRLNAWMHGFGAMAEVYADAFDGARVALSETHQADKLDTSGTMKHMLGHMSALSGRTVERDEILSIRDPRVQSHTLGVPEDWIGWHAYHFIDVSNEHDGVRDSEALTFRRHGGECYRLGTMDGVNFLAKGKNAKYFNTMHDVWRKAG